MKKVLVVDDAAFMRLAIRQILEENGYQVVAEAENGEKAIEKYTEYLPDLVTMDITMPEMTGIEALKVIKVLDPKAVVIMITALGQESMVREAIVSGAKSFIVKPFQKEQFLKTIQSIIG
jgi:two-component system chemotaxis response regulator CheY